MKINKTKRNPVNLYKGKTARQLIGRNPKQKRLGWHLINTALRLYYGHLGKVAIGKKIEMKACTAYHKMPSVCKQGMHASHVIHKTMKSAGPILCRVLIEGDITDYRLSNFDWRVRLDKAKDKFAGRYRTVLWMKKIPDHLWGLQWGLYDNTAPGVSKKLDDWARENDAPFVDHESFGKLKRKVKKR